MRTCRADASRCRSNCSHLRNTVRPHRHRKRAHEPQAPGSLAEPPEFLTPAAREHWTFAIAYAPPILAAIDRDLLATWSDAVATKHEASGLQQEQDRDSPHNLLVKTSRGDLAPSPYLRVRLASTDVVEIRTEARYGVAV